MTLSWAPVVLVDTSGSVLTLLLSLWCARLAWGWTSRKKDDIFRNYLFLFTVAIVFFAVSRSFGHLIKQILILHGMAGAWGRISPFSGAVNSTAFVVIFAFGVYFQRFRKIHAEIETYKNELESLVDERTAELEQANTSLKEEVMERREAERALAAEKERLAVTLRSIGDGVITTDIEGTVVLMNKVAEGLTGWRQEEAVGKPHGEVLRIYSPGSGEPAPDPVQAVLESGEIAELKGPSVLAARDGRKIHIDDSAAPIRDAESRIVGAVLVFRDVTEKIRMEEELLKVKKLESVGVLAGGIAHDFNNILTAILGNINLAREFMDPNDGAYPLLDEAEKASYQARNLTSQLLTFSKGGEPVRKVSSIAEVIRDSANFVLHGGKVACEFRMPEDLWPVEIDRGQMSQVIQNLILNAAQAMPEGGVVEITCRNVPAGSKTDYPLAPGAFVEIFIHDTGVGIPPNYLEKIFDPYFSTKKEGSGLGLAITHSIIGKHGGHVSAQSSPGEGTTFHIYLPASPGALQEKKKTAPSAARGEGRILVMDDEEMVRAIAGRMLSHLGYQVEAVPDGAEAVALYRQRLEECSPFDGVIMDLTIPGGMGGRDAVREVLALDPGAKVIVSSGYSNDPVMANFGEYGFRGSVLKPYRLEDLSRIVKRVLARP